MTKTYYYVYLLFRETGIPMYVGKGCKNRWNHDKRVVKGRSHLDNAINDIHERGYTVPKVKIAENLTEEDAWALEIIFIRAIGREINGGPLINQTDGGDGCKGLSYEIRMRIGRQVSAKLSGLIRSEETRKRMSVAQKSRSPEFMLPAWLANKGSKRTPESKQKMRAAKLGKVLSEQHKENLRKSSGKGKGPRYTMTDVTREKMRAAKLGTSVSQETRDRMSVSHRGKRLTEEHKNNMRKAKKRANN